MKKTKEVTEDMGRTIIWRNKEGETVAEMVVGEPITEVPMSVDEPVKGGGIRYGDHDPSKAEIEYEKYMGVDYATGESWSYDPDRRAEYETQAAVLGALSIADSLREHGELRIPTYKTKKKRVRMRDILVGLVWYAAVVIAITLKICGVIK